MAVGTEASNSMILELDAAEILHSRSVITPDELKIFRGLDEDYRNFRKKLFSWKLVFPPSVQALLPLEPATQDSSPKDKCKDSHEGSSETEQITYPVYKSLPPELGSGSDILKKHTDFSFVLPALNFFNQKNDTNLKLVDITHMRIFYFHGMWAHCVFQVALPNSPNNNNLFAEVLRNDETYEEKYEVRTVALLHGSPCYKCQACDGFNIPYPQNFVSDALPSTPTLWISSWSSTST